MTKPSILHYITIADAGQSGEDESLLERLTQAELRALNDWACSQPCAEDPVDLMGWPGWNDVTVRIQANMQAAWEQALNVVHRIMESSKN
ncbi:hypothetical protein [Ralstonia mannitolilytica]|uniref:hypothetical protein n=1 Tax=Ralstonia mannitolilytica TaxID=105219 RepID=UPI003749F6DC